MDYGISWWFGRLDVRLYVSGVSGPFPTVVFFHGGGYEFGNIATHDRLCRHLTLESGYALRSVDYRPAPEHPLPAAVEGIYAAVGGGDFQSGCRGRAGCRCW